MLLHFTEFQRSACASSPFRLAVDSEKAAPINRSLGDQAKPKPAVDGRRWPEARSVCQSARKLRHSEHILPTVSKH
jgi:hypothetical protein